MTEPARRVLVLNHYAPRRGEAGGSRHVEFFSRLERWSHLIIASDLNHYTGARVKVREPEYRTVHVPRYAANGPRRILNWVAYSVGATVAGLRSGSVDVVYGSSPHLLTPVAAYAVSRVRGAAFVLEVRDLFGRVLVELGGVTESSLAFRGVRRLEHFLYRHAAAVVVMAEGSVDQLISEGVDRTRIHYIPNGAEPSEFVASRPRTELRAHYGFDRMTFVYAGAHGPANGLDLLISAAAHVRDLPVDIVLVGGGVDKERVRRLAETAGLDNVRFLDPIPKSEIADLLTAADVGLHVLADVDLFRRAVSPNKVFDYMAAGLPVLTNCPGLVADLVAGSGAGIAVDPEDLAAGIRTMAQLTPEQLRNHGDHGREWVVENQSRTAMARRLEDVLDEVAALGR